jgi:hypothetical protein
MDLVEGETVVVVIAVQAEDHSGWRRGAGRVRHGPPDLAAHVPAGEAPGPFGRP